MNWSLVLMEFLRGRKIIFISYYCVQVGGGVGGCVCTSVEVKVSSSYLCGFQGLDVGHQACMGSIFIHWAIAPAQETLFINCRLNLLRFRDLLSLTPLPLPRVCVSVHMSKCMVCTYTRTHAWLNVCLCLVARGNSWIPFLRTAHF